MTETKATDLESDSSFKTGVSLWLSFCVFVCVWFLSHFMKGRRQLQNNLHVIEDGLRRMQDEVEKRQRENSIGYGENLENLTEEQFKNIVNNMTEEVDKAKANPTQECAESGDVEEEVVGVTPKDKKND